MATGECWNSIQTDCHIDSHIDSQADSRTDKSSTITRRLAAFESPLLCLLPLGKL